LVGVFIDPCGRIYICALVSDHKEAVSDDQVVVIAFELGIKFIESCLVFKGDAVDCSHVPVNSSDEGGPGLFTGAGQSDGFEDDCQFAEGRRGEEGDEVPVIVGFGSGGKGGVDLELPQQFECSVGRVRKEVEDLLDVDGCFGRWVGAI
jgi:hypothetical protein